jgi:hypothetical protein
MKKLQSLRQLAHGDAVAQRIGSVKRGEIWCRERLGGLLKLYYRDAA